MPISPGMGEFGNSGLEAAPASAAGADGRQEDPGYFGRDLSPTAFRKALLWLFLLGLLIRIGFLVEHAGSPSFGVPTLDQKYYDTVARMLVAGEDLHQLHGFRPLLYPMFLAVLYKMGGTWGVDLAIVVQHLLGVATGLIVALLGARVFRHRLSGVIAGALFLIAPVPVYFEGELLIEPSYTFLICAGLLLHLEAAQTQGRRAGLLWLLCGGVIVLAAQARANILVFLAVYPLLAGWWLWRTRAASALWPVAGLVGAFSMMIPWGIINMRQSDHFHLMPNAGGVAFYVGNKRGADGMLVGQDVIAALSQLSMQRQRSSDEAVERSVRVGTGQRYQDLVEVWAREEYEAAMRAQGQAPDPDPMAVSRYWSGRAVAEIRAAPAAWLALVGKKVWLTFWNAEIPNNKDFAFLQQEFFWLRLLPIRWVVLLMLAPAGLWAAAKWGYHDGLFILLVYASFYSAANVGFFVCDRYRYPVWPAMAVLGGGGLLWTIELVRRCSVRPVLCVFGSTAAMAVLSLHNWFGVTLPNFAQDYFFRSAAWYEKGRFPEALSDIDRSVALDPLRAETQQHRGNVLFAMSRWADAAQAYQQAVKLMPGNAGVWNNLGASLDALGSTAEALVAFRRATELTPPSRNAFLGLALVQMRSGRVEEAAVSLDKLQTLAPPNDPSILAARAALAARRGDGAQAGALERQARAIDGPTVDWVMGRLAGAKREK